MRCFSKAISRAGQLNKGVSAERRRSRDAGFSLVELLVAIGIASFVSLMLVQLLNVTTGFHRRASTQATLQNDSQQTASRIEKAVMEADWIVTHKDGGNVLLFLGTLNSEDAANKAALEQLSSGTAGGDDADSPVLPASLTFTRWTAFYYSEKHKALYEDWVDETGSASDLTFSANPQLSDLASRLGISDDPSTSKPYLIAQNVKSFEVTAERGGHAGYDKTDKASEDAAAAATAAASGSLNNSANVSYTITFKDAKDNGSFKLSGSATTRNPLPDLADSVWNALVQ